MIYEYSQRVKRAIEKGQQPVLVFVSDFDPSGMNMLDSIEKKMKREAGVDSVIYNRVALTPEQIEQGDIAPGNTGDGEITISDLLQITKQVQTRY